MSHHQRYRRRTEPNPHDLDESAPCGCRRIKPVGANRWFAVVVCPDHPESCPGPWSRSVVPTGDCFDYDGDPSEDDETEYDREEMEYERALGECGKVPVAEGGCLMAGTEFCDFECPFRDDE
jgi:hypothetical protein